MGLVSKSFLSSSCVDQSLSMLYETCAYAGACVALGELEEG